jgi:MraZ protein
MTDYAHTAERFFLGETACAVDAQRRVAIPKNWRLASDTDATRFFLIPGPQHTIQLLTSEHFQRLMIRARAVAISDPEESNRISFLASQAQEIIPDKHGRFAINPLLFQYAGLKDKAVMIGAFTFGRIMTPETWEKIKPPMEDCLKGLSIIEKSLPPQQALL